MVTGAELRREKDALRGQLVQLAASSAGQLDRLIATNAELTAQVARLNDRVTVGGRVEPRKLEPGGDRPELARVGASG